MSCADWFLAFIAILFPPLAVWVKCGLCSVDSLINILLSSLGYIPGLLHAWYIIAKYPDELEYERVPQDYESGHGHGHRTERITYVFVPAPQMPSPSPSQQQQHQHQAQTKSGSAGPAMNYGTTSTNAPAAAAAGSSSSVPAPSHHQNDEASGSNDHHAPPTYAEAVKGDHKIQSDD